MDTSRYPEEKGQMIINGARMEWIFRRYKAESAFCINGSRIFDLRLVKDGKTIGKYNMGWEKKIPDEDEEGNLCLTYILGRFGKQRKKVKKDG